MKSAGLSPAAAVPDAVNNPAITATAVVMDFAAAGTLSSQTPFDNRVGSAAALSAVEL
jgi:hypothetical protein